MATDLLSRLSCLSEAQISALKKGNITTVSDLLLSKPLDISKKCRLAPTEVRSIIEAVCTQSMQSLLPINDSDKTNNGKFTTGDADLDRVLGGGIRTGMLWEIAGESAAGKTQLAFQLSLMVQLPPTLGGLSGSTCYITTSSQLPTERLVQMRELHPMLSPEHCSLDQVLTLTAETIPKLLLVLRNHFPGLVERLGNDPKSKPVKLLVIDALAELFHSASKTTTTTLVERSRNISQISGLLHAIASKHQIALLVLNEVVDVFDRDRSTDASARGELEYREQVRWFGRADSTPGEDSKEAALGLVWANQVNARIMLSRTNRRRRIEDAGKRNGKRRRVDTESLVPPEQSRALVGDQSLSIRRLSVIFSSVSAPASVDFVVTAAGVSAVSEDATLHSVPFVQGPSTTANAMAPTAHVSPLDEGCIRDELSASQVAEAEAAADDDEAEYWIDDESLDALYSAVDLDNV